MNNKPTQNKKILVCIIEYCTSTLIDNILKELNVEYFKIYPNNNPKNIPTHIILSGGHDHVYENNHRPIPKWVLDSDIKVFGICYGMQLVAHTFGGVVSKMKEKEEGFFYVDEYQLFNNKIDNKLSHNLRWFNRFDNVYKCPPNFTILGVNDKNLIVSITDNIKFWGVQYHPENPNALDYNFFCSFFSYYNK